MWRKVDQLELPTEQELDPTVLAALGARLRKGGHLSGPVPSTDDSRQGAIGRAHDDGVVGLARSWPFPEPPGGYVGPSITEGALPSAVLPMRLRR